MTGYDYGVGRFPEDVRTAPCHTFEDGHAYPDLCLTRDCPARPPRPPEWILVRIFTAEDGRACVVDSTHQIAAGDTTGFVVDAANTHLGGAACAACIDKLRT